MKRINLLLFSLIFLACQNTPTKTQEQNKTLVGTLENEKVVLTVDKTKMLAAYNANILKASGIDAKFTEVSIKTTSDKQYYLVFKGSGYTSSFIITTTNNDLFALDNISCTTSDCSSEEFGCTPTVSGAACRACSNKGKCTKTVSNRSLLN